MIKNKQGLSGIVVALIIIGIALAAVGIVWYVLSVVMEEQAANVETASGEVFQSCVDAGYELMTDVLVNCGGTVKYVGGEKCCTIVPTA